MNRREFLEAGGGILLVAGSSAAAVRMLMAKRTDPGGTGRGRPGHKWGMVIDVNRCKSDCRACLDACKQENNISQPGDKRWDVHWIRKVTLRDKHDENAVEKPVVLLCNHCDDPPCAQVCPVQATFKRHDGIVLVDYHRCIGCRYCVIACPYNARYFNFKEAEEWSNEGYPRRSHGVAEACNLCAPRLESGRMPACVDACHQVGADAISVGDTEDPESDISQLIARTAAKGIREDLGTKPRVRYIGL